MVGDESRIHLLQVQQTPHEQARAGKQHERQRNFSDDERLTQSVAASAARSAPFVLQRVARLGARRVQRRHQTEHDRGGDGEAEREQQHAGIECTPRRRGMSHRTGRDQCRLAPRREQQPPAPAEHGERQRLGEQLADDPPATRAERRADRHLAPPHCSSREQQIRDIGARDEQHHADRGEEDEKPGLVIPHQHATQRHRAHRPIAVRVGVLRGEARGDRASSAFACSRLVPARRWPMPRMNEAPRCSANCAIIPIAVRRQPGLHWLRVKGKLERCRHDADDRRRLAVERDRPSDDSVAAAESPVPERLADHHRPRPVLHVIVGGQPAPAQRRNAERCEEVSGDRRDRERFGVADAGERRAASSAYPAT